MTDQQQQQQRTWTEAPASWNIKYRIGGYDEQITLRGNSYADIVEHVNKARDYVKGLRAAPTSSASADAVNIEPTPVEVMAVATAPAAQAPTQPQSTLAFEVERIEANVNAGKVSWRVKGGHFLQYGVICWPEVIKTAGLTLDPAVGSYPMLGWIAEYVTKDDGKPQKVTRLYKPAA